NADDRQEFFNSAQGRALKPIPSHTNFYMMDITVPVQRAIEHFKKHRILVGRPFPPMDNFLRVSLGQPKEMLEFWRVWDLFGVHPNMHEKQVGGLPDTRIRPGSTLLFSYLFCSCSRRPGRRKRSMANAACHHARKPYPRFFAAQRQSAGSGRVGELSPISSGESVSCG